MNPRAAAVGVAVAGLAIAVVRLGVRLAGGRTPVWLAWASAGLWAAALVLIVLLLRATRG
jgi:hypothetical protein